MNIIDLHKKFISCNQEICTDTRSLVPGSLFFAWKGEKKDGNMFAKEALEKGAAYVVVDNSNYVIDDRCILVDDSIRTFQELAQFHRSQFNIPIIAIGGSNGKTTTKELVAGVLRSQKNVIASIGSLNNHVGVPKTLLRINSHTEIAVVEMGANHLGEIATLCKIAQPTHGIITNIGRDHIGLFGGVGAVIEANLELYEYLQNNNGYVFVNKNNQQLMSYSVNLDRTCFGECAEISDFTVRSLKSSPCVSLEWKRNTIHTQITGEYNIENISAAIAIGVHFNISAEGIIKGIQSYQPNNNRSEIVKTIQGNLLIKDFYNANRTSMERALDNLAFLHQSNPEKKSIAIIGDMLELGEFSREEHQAVVDYAHKQEISKIILIGPDFNNTDHENCESYQDVDDAINELEKRNFSNTIILLKASNGTNFSKLFNNIDW